MDREDTEDSRESMSSSAVVILVDSELTDDERDDTVEDSEDTSDVRSDTSAVRSLTSDSSVLTLDVSDEMDEV